MDKSLDPLQLLADVCPGCAGLHGRSSCASLGASEMPKACQKVGAVTEASMRLCESAAFEASEIVQACRPVGRRMELDGTAEDCLLIMSMCC